MTFLQFMQRHLRDLEARRKGMLKKGKVQGTEEELEEEWEEEWEELLGEELEDELFQDHEEEQKRLKNRKPRLPRTLLKRLSEVEDEEEELFEDLEDDLEEVEEALNDLSDMDAHGRASFWFGVLSTAAMMFSGGQSALVVPDSVDPNHYYVFTRNRRVEFEISVLPDGTVQLNVLKVPTRFYTLVRRALLPYRRMLRLLPPLETNDAKLVRTLRVYRELDVREMEGEEEGL